jgi:hypothetical protein
MCSARWLNAAVLMTVVAASSLACRRYPDPPVVPEDASSVGAEMDASAPDSGGLPPRPSGQTPDTRPPDRPADTNPDVGPACGAPGQSCCPGNRCGTGCCVGAICVAPFNGCPGVAAACTTTTCGGVCGGLQEPCCGDAGYCARELTICQRTDASSRCQPCGNTGELCCTDSYCEPPNRRCLNNRCVAM